MPPSALSAEKCVVTFWTAALERKFGGALYSRVANRHRVAVATEISAHTYPMPHTIATP